MEGRPPEGCSLPVGDSGVAPRGHFGLCEEIQPRAREPDSVLHGRIAALTRVTMVGSRTLTSTVWVPATTRVRKTRAARARVTASATASILAVSASVLARLAATAVVVASLFLASSHSEVFTGDRTETARECVCVRACGAEVGGAKTTKCVCEQKGLVRPWVWTMLKPQAYVGSWLTAVRSVCPRPEDAGCRH